MSEGGSGDIWRRLSKKKTITLWRKCFYLFVCLFYLLNVLLCLSFYLYWKYFGEVVTASAECPAGSVHQDFQVAEDEGMSTTGCHQFYFTFLILLYLVCLFDSFYLLTCIISAKTYYNWRGLSYSWSAPKSLVRPRTKIKTDDVSQLTPTVQKRSQNSRKLNTYFQHVWYFYIRCNQYYIISDCSLCVFLLEATWRACLRVSGIKCLTTAESCQAILMLKQPQHSLQCSTSTEPGLEIYRVGAHDLPKAS